jgi:hypothetical protein
MLDFAHWNLSKLPMHGWQIITSCMIWTILYYSVQVLYKRSKAYQALSNSKKSDFAVCHVSLFHSTIILFMAFPMLFDKTLVNNKVHGYTYYSGSVLAVTTGYFLWDTILCLRSVRIQGYQFTLHALACLVIFLLSFVIYYFNHRNQYLIILVHYS